MSMVVHTESEAMEPPTPQSTAQSDRSTKTAYFSLITINVITKYKLYTGHVTLQVRV